MRAFLAVSNAFTALVVIVLVALASIISSQVAAHQVESSINGTIYSIVQQATNASRNSSTKTQQLFDQVKSLCDNTPGCSPK